MTPASNEPAKHPTDENAASELSTTITSQGRGLETQSQQLDGQQLDGQRLDDPQVDEHQVQARINHLIDRIKESLRSRTLNAKTQKELARLLSLTPNLKSQHLQQLNLLDLAVSTLLETEQSDPQHTAPNDRGKAPAPNTQTDLKNLVFVQETRRQIAQQSRLYPNVLRAIFITGTGTPYIRLISGLSWFFVIFVLGPLIMTGASFYVREIISLKTGADAVGALVDEKLSLQTTIETQNSQIASLTEQKDSLANQLGATGYRIGDIVETSPKIASEAEEGTTFIQVESNVLSALETAIYDSLGESATQLPATQLIENNTDETERKKTQPTQGNARGDSLTTTSNQQVQPQKTVAEASTTPSVLTEEQKNQAKTQATDDAKIQAAENRVATRKIFKTSLTLILLAVSMGAMGSTVSVIVRANTFIRQAQESDNDLFLTGFFRPFVGMSFAIFCVALVEAGIFSGIFNIEERAEDRTYFYVAIAFVAGFSERLVRDVVSKTEDTLAGPRL